MPNHNNTTELEKLLNDMCNEVQNNSSWTMLGGDPPDLTPYLTQLQNLTIKERQAELAQTVLAGMPELTPKQQEFVENRLQELEKTFKENNQ